ncbi:MAG: DNA repair protein RecN [Chlamydiota bacterium]
MIKYLSLNNLVLVESSQLSLGNQFNAITGETGAGKTALIEAIELALGSRADSSMIRKGCDRAFVEVSFDITHLPRVHELLDEAGIALEPTELLIIRREITHEGKNRAFINCRSAPLPLLQTIGAELIDLIDQHAPHALRKSEEQRALVDLFGNLKDELTCFQQALRTEKTLHKQLSELQTRALQKEREEEILRFQIEEISTVQLKENEEEELFERYKRLANSQEILEKIDTLVKSLSESPSAVLTQMRFLQKHCDALEQFDQSLAETATLMRDGQLALSEAFHNLQSYRNKVDSDPRTLQLHETRLQAITQLKRKYGQSFTEIDAFYKKCKEDLDRLENIDESLTALNTELKDAQEHTHSCAKHLTQKRKETATLFQKLLTEQLRSLNIPGAEVSIEIASQERNQSGDDEIRFWLKANTGEQPALVKDQSSGGELSRLLLAIKISLAEKNNTPTLIFDEIDANVGGTTATIIGEKLKELGKHRQVLCITHFPQVASHADLHFSVKKQEKEGRTTTQIKQLTSKERDAELLRMLGGKNTLAHL